MSSATATLGAAATSVGFRIRTTGAAVITFRRNGNELSFCLVTTSGGSKWTFPKGIIDSAETARETALKEEFVETGLHGTLVGDHVGSFEVDVWYHLLSGGLPDGRDADRPNVGGETDAPALVQGRPIAALFLESVRRLRLT